MCKYLTIFQILAHPVLLYYLLFAPNYLDSCKHIIRKYYKFYQNHFQKCNKKADQYRQKIQEDTKVIEKSVSPF